MLDAITPQVAPWPPGAAPITVHNPRPGFTWTLLARHGRRPLGFEGRLLVQAASRSPRLPVWSDLSVHETAGGALVAAIQHDLRTAAGEPAGMALHYAEAATDPAALLAWLRRHDPLADLPSDVLLGPVGWDDLPAGLPMNTLTAPLVATALREAWQALLAATFGGARRGAAA